MNLTVLLTRYQRDMVNYLNLIMVKSGKCHKKTGMVMLILLEVSKRINYV